MSTVRLTMAQALVRYLCAQRTEVDGGEAPLFGGVWAIFGHGNVAGFGEALHAAQAQLPTLRAHNEQAMALAAIAFAKAHARRHMMVCTTSIGPGATNMVTAAAVAHVNRLPVLLLPGDVFANRIPDPVLQQVESFGDPTISANDCFRPVSRYWDRITRPEQLLQSLPAALAVLTDPAACGPATLALPQDVQAEAFEYPEHFFEPRTHRLRRPGSDPAQLASVADRLRRAERPLLIAGGGVHYSLAESALRAFAERHGIPVAETQAGKGALPWDHPACVGAIGVCGSSAANALAADADLVLAVGTRLADFPTGSRALFQGPNLALVALNVAPHDAGKHGALPLVADARRGLEELSAALGAWRAPAARAETARRLTAEWTRLVDTATASGPDVPATEAQVIGAVNRAAGPRDVLVCAAGGLPGELSRLWRTREPRGYHLEYGYSCMGYEIAGGLGVKLALPDREVFVMVGDGSYLMMNSEIATSVAMHRKLVIVLLDNRGFGCINRLQVASGGASFNNLLGPEAPAIDFAAHARSLGAQAEQVKTVAASRARSSERAGPTGRPSWSSRPTPRDPSPAAERGGTSPYPRSRPGPRSRPRATRTTRRAAGSEPEASVPVRIGVNPIGWTNDDLETLGDDISLETCLEEARRAGYAGIELGRKFPRRPAELRAVLQQHGLDLVSGWYGSHLLRRSVKEEIAAMQEHAGLLTALASTAMVFAEETGSVHGRLGVPLSTRPRLAEGDWPKFGEALTEVAEHLAGRGMRLAYHHHMGTVVETEAEIDRLMGATGPAVGLLLDTGHLTYAGGDVLAVARRHAGRVVHVHCKDVRSAVLVEARRRDRSFLDAVVDGVFTVPGDGCVDYRALLEILRNAGYAGWLVVEAEQDPVKAHPLTYARMGFAHLSRLLADLRL
jgi:3D-(3,5/4)-trihydroxycyclohexane-1,2-dione acylhydrolase (decyclizing)